MIRAGFKRKGLSQRITKQICPEYKPRPRPVAAPAPEDERPPATMPKEGALQHEGYMAAVRGLKCYRCGLIGFTQFCHSDEGKGMALKTDCRRGWPGCGPHGGLPGCHHIIGTSGLFTREFCRQFQVEAAAATRREIRDMGLWPATLPAWPSDEVNALDEGAPPCSLSSPA